MYTSDTAARVVLSLLKQYGIKKIVVSPGSTNAPISMTVQSDPWFEVYSVVDERSAAYFATGLAYESGEPVVISCTGATASRNYLSALTEAYYRNLPVIALTSQHHVVDHGDLTPQVTDRSVSQNDIKKVSVMLPFVKDEEDLKRCEVLVNDALIQATTRGCGPVHINLLVDSTYPFSESKEQFEARKISYCDIDEVSATQSDLKKELANKKIGVFIGSHKKFTDYEESALEDFATSYGAAVFVDHTSSYAGANAVQIGQIFSICDSKNRPDLIIDLGGISGVYEIYGALGGVPVWRISEDGKIHDRFHSMVKLFDVKESQFFDLLSSGKSSKNQYFNELSKEVSRIVVPDLPLSNTYVSYQLSKNIPKGSNLHLGILNSLRNMDFYELDKSIDASSNVGGFGIDGPLSTIIGQSMVDKNKLYFSLVGDLAFFYDMNALGIRSIGNNIRILLINNNQGVEFRLNSVFESKLGDKVNDLIAARGHNTSARAWVESVGFTYLSANAKEDFDRQIGEFCSPDIGAFDAPVVFEVFTNIDDEQAAYDLIRMQ